MQKSPDKLVILCVYFSTSIQVLFDRSDVSIKDSLVN